MPVEFQCQNPKCGKVSVRVNGYSKARPPKHCSPRCAYDCRPTSPPRVLDHTYSAKVDVDPLLAKEMALLREQTERLNAKRTRPKQTRHHGGGKYQRHLVIPDTQCNQDSPTSHLKWLGKYIAEKQPDVVIHLGDHWDMSSLSEYDKGKKCFEGRRYKKDIDAGNAGMDALMTPLTKMKKLPRLVFTLGNHEQRIDRAIQTNPTVEGLIGYQNFNLAMHGWEVNDFLVPVDIGGILYAHYFYNPMTGKPWGGTVHTMLKTIGHSFTQGHKQGLDFARRALPSGESQIGIVAGSFYQHDELYKGPQAQNHWRGVIMKNEVKDGEYDPLFISMGYLKRKFG